MLQKRNTYTYIITNIINGKQYVGIAIDPERRWVEHRCGHGSKILCAAFQKYGLENFKFSVVFEGSEQQAKDTEIRLIAHYVTMAPHGYNLTVGGEGSTGWIPSVVTRKKMSTSRIGNKNGMFGKKHSIESRLKQSIKAKQRKLTPERVKFLQNLSKGVKNGRACPIKINGIKYDYIGQAARALNIKASTLRTYVGRFRQTGSWPRTLKHLTINLLQKKEK